MCAPVWLYQLCHFTFLFIRNIIIERDVSLIFHTHRNYLISFFCTITRGKNNIIIWPNIFKNPNERNCRPHTEITKQQTTLIKRKTNRISLWETKYHDINENKVMSNEYIWKRKKPIVHTIQV